MGWGISLDKADDGQLYKYDQPWFPLRLMGGGDFSGGLGGGSFREAGGP
jgi:hypothetical protein